GDVHGRQVEAVQLQEGQPEVRSGRRREPKEPQGPSVERPGKQVGARAAGKHGEGAASSVLHHAPLRHHARVLEGL
ncbi:unnamed protein product, partial [Urochloa humidicola]